MPNRKTKISIKTFEVTIIRVRRGDDSADVSAYGQQVIPVDNVDALRQTYSPELPEASEKDHDRDD